MSEQKFKYKYKEIALPRTKITKTGGCLYMLIKKDAAKKYGLEKGDKVIPTIFLTLDKITEKEEKRHKEIDLPLTKVTKTGGCLAILIKKKIAEEEGLKPGDKVLPILLKRVFRISV